MPSSDVEVVTNILRPFSHGLSIEVLHEFVGYIPDVLLSSRNGATHVDGNILSSDILEAFHATNMIYLRENCSDNVEGHRQKL